MKIKNDLDHDSPIVHISTFLLVSDLTCDIGVFTFLLVSDLTCDIGVFTFFLVSDLTCDIGVFGRTKEAVVSCNTTSQCILESWICDGVMDCWDNNDEKKCSNKTTGKYPETCLKRPFKGEQYAKLVVDL